MALVTLTNPIAVGTSRLFSAAAGVTTASLAATTKKVAWILLLAPNEAIDTIGIYVTSRAGLPKIRLSIQGVTSRTTPADGVIKTGTGGVGSCKVDWTGGSDTINDWNLKTLETRYINETGAPLLVAVVCEYQGTGQDFDASNAIGVGYGTTTCDGNTKSGPWAATKTTTTWTAQTTQPVLIAKDTVTSSYVDSTLFTAKAPATQNFSSVANAQYGCRFDPSFGGRIWGVEIGMRTVSGGFFSVIVHKNGVYNQSVALQENGLLSANSSTSIIRIPLATPVLVVPGDYLQILINGDTVSNQTYFGKMTYNSAADLQAMWSSLIKGCSSTLDSEAPDPTVPISITDEPTNFYPVLPLYDQIDIREASGGGGGGSGSNNAGCGSLLFV